MSRFYGNFDPASTATTVTVTIDTDYNSARFLSAVAPSTSSSVKYYHSFESTLTTIQFGGATVSSNAGAVITTNTTSVKIGTQSLNFTGSVLPVTVVPSAGGAFSLTSAYTLELFFRREGTGGVWSTMLGSTNANEITPGWPFLSTYGNKFRAKSELISSTTISNNVWYHGALVRYSDGSGALFLNGVKEATKSSLAEFVTDNFVLGAINHSQASDGYWKGQLDDIRFTREALYSTTFTVPTKPLFVPGSGDVIDTVSDTRSHSHVWNYTDVYDARFADTWPDLVYDTQIALYLPFNGSLTDFSSYGHTVSAVGDAAVTTSPFQFHGSCAFDGNGDLLTVPHNNIFDFVGNDFTIEGFINPTTAAGVQGVYAQWGGTGSRSFKVVISTAAKLEINGSKDGSSGNQINQIASTALELNTFSHFAVTREGSNFRIFINGVNRGTTTDSGNLYNSSANIAIGGNRADQTTSTLFGNLEDFRVINGLALYTTAFEVPTRSINNTLTVNP